MISYKQETGIHTIVEKGLLSHKSANGGTAEATDTDQLFTKGHNELRKILLQN